MKQEVSTYPQLTNEYIVRCCELIDGGDNPGEQSSAEGTCMAELLVVADKQSSTKITVPSTGTAGWDVFTKEAATKAEAE
jgi:hypothetical protein